MVLDENDLADVQENSQDILVNVNIDGNKDEAWVSVKADADKLKVHETIIDAMQHMSW